MYRCDKLFMKNPATASSRIYIGNIPESVTAANLDEKFRVHGKILGLVLQRGFGFIQFENENQAQTAIHNELGSIFHGKKLNVQQAVAKGLLKGPQNTFQPMPSQLPILSQRTPTPETPAPPFSQQKQQNTPQRQEPPQLMKMDTSVPPESNIIKPPENELGLQSGPPDMNTEGNIVGGGGGGGGPDHRRRGRRGGGVGRNNTWNRDREWHRDYPSDDFIVRDVPPHEVPSVRDVPPREGPLRDMPQRTLPARDMPLRDLPPREIPLQDMPPRDIPSRDMPPRDMPPRDIPPRDMPSRDVPPRDVPPRDMPPRDMPPYFGREENYRPGFVPPSTLDRPERNDCEIIVVSKLLTEYAEYIEQRLKSVGLVVDLLYPNEDVPIGRVLANISSRGCLYAILVMPQNEECRSLTLNVLHGIPQEHRNIPLEDAFILIARNFDAYMRGEKISFNTPGSETNSLNDRHPEQIQMLLNLLAENRQLTRVQYDRIIKYLQERRELQHQFEITEGGGEPDPEPEPNSKQAELQSRIMNILNKSAEDVPKPVEAPPPQAGATPLLKDPSVQKALDSLLCGDMFKSISANY